MQRKPRYVEQWYNNLKAQTSYTQGVCCVMHNNWVEFDVTGDHAKLHTL